jgi:hypothetical protein
LSNYGGNWWPLPRGIPASAPGPQPARSATSTPTPRHHLLLHEKLKKIDLLHPNQEHAESRKNHRRSKEEQFRIPICYIPFLLSLYHNPPDTIFFPNEKLNPEQEDLLHPKGKHNTRNTVAGKRIALKG